MLSLASPQWLLGLLALPVIWWLYRQSKRPKDQLVSAIWLWPETAVSSDDVQAQPFSDPRWWTYAALWVLFLLALSELSFDGLSHPPITVWLDDSISMQTLEQGQTRQQLALQKLQLWLRATASTDVTIRALSDHTKFVNIKSLDSSLLQTKWQTKLQNWSTAGSPHLPVLFDANKEHWLVTDGADSALLQPNRFHRLMQVGTERTNAGLTHLSVRPNLLHPKDSLVAMFKTATFTSAGLPRKLTVTADGQVLATRALLLTDGEYQGEFSLPRTAQNLTLRLEPADQLALDDQLSLALSDLVPLSTNVDDSCGDALQRALAAIPLIQIVDGNTESNSGASLSVLCDQAASSADQTDSLTEERPTSTHHQIFLYSTNASSVVLNPLRWHADAQAYNRLFLDAQGLSTSVYNGRGQVLLSAGPSQQPLIVRNGRNTHVLLDLGALQITSEPAYPYLVAAIAQIAARKNLANPTAVQNRLVRESRVGPLPLDVQLLDLNSPGGRTQTPMTGFFVTLLIVLLLANIIRRTSFGREIVARVPRRTPSGALS